MLDCQSLQLKWIITEQQPVMNIFLHSNLFQYNTQHPCRRCNLKCSIEKYNEVHRIHREADPCCRILNYNLKCPKCDDTFNQQETLDNHFHNEHSRFIDFVELSLACDGSPSKLYIKCTNCTSLFENEYGLQRHTESIHTDDTRKRKHQKHQKNKKRGI